MCQPSKAVKILSLEFQILVLVIYLIFVFCDLRFLIFELWDTARLRLQLRFNHDL